MTLLPPGMRRKLSGGWVGRGEEHDFSSLLFESPPYNQLAGETDRQVVAGVYQGVSRAGTGCYCCSQRSSQA